MSDVTKDNFEEFKKADKIVALAFLPSATDAPAAEFSATANKHRDDYLFGLSTDKAVAEAAGVTPPAIVLFRSFDDPQTEFPKFLDHSAGWNMIGQYINSTQVAQQAGKPFIMFETNSASCGGFPGISTSFGAALWALDYGLTMASANFSHALLHVGGQNVYYNVSLLACAVIHHIC